MSRLVRLPSVGDINRRTLLTLGGETVAAAATMLLAACGSRGPRGSARLLRYTERRNETVQRMLFRHTSMDAARNRWKNAGTALPSYYVSRTVPIWDVAARGPWTLEISGLVQRPIRLTLDDLQQLPRLTQRVNHYCVEGWTAVETWTGVRLSELVHLVGVRPEAQYVDFRSSFDVDPSSATGEGYHESWDIESALHPQTCIAYGLDGHLLAPAHGAPARVYSPIKLGYKNTKYLTKIVFMAARNGGYWSDMGYEWYAGV